jgi:hypothetical protein
VQTDSLVLELLLGYLPESLYFLLEGFQLAEVSNTCCFGKFQLDIPFDVLGILDFKADLGYLPLHVPNLGIDLVEQIFVFGVVAFQLLGILDLSFAPVNLLVP